MLLSRSVARKIGVTAFAAIGFSLLHQAKVADSRSAARQAELREETAAPAPGLKLRFAATAYCKGTTTASGATVRTGIAAADPALLPVGSVIQVDGAGRKYNGIYAVMDTGPAVQGREVDLYMWSCHEALAFGRRRVQITVLRLGWNPAASTPGIIGSLFRTREAAARQRGTAAPAPSPSPPGQAAPATAPSSEGSSPSRQPGVPQPPDH